MTNKVTEYRVNGQKVAISPKFVFNYLVSGSGAVTEKEVVMFIQLCRYQHLNPYLHDAYLVKFGHRPAQIIVSKSAYMKRAAHNKNFDHYNAGIIVGNKKDRTIHMRNGAFYVKQFGEQLLGAWCDVYLKDRKEPIKSRINFDEFNKGQATWKKMPAVMIRKTAIVQALREAFPLSLGDMYTSDDQDVNDMNSAPKSVNATEEKPEAKTTAGLIPKSTSTNNDSKSSENSQKGSVADGQEDIFASSKVSETAKANTK